jgi:hypothetical protein
VPTTVTELMFWGMTAVIATGSALIGYLLHSGFTAVKDELTAIRDALSAEHYERERLSTELTAMRRVCDERHGVPHRRSEDDTFYCSGK